jgi:hypothetical protein
MLSDALVLAILSTIGLIMLYKKLPRKIRKFLEKHAVFTDFLTFILTYITLGSTLTALTAGAMVAIMTSCIIHILANKNDFLYVYDLLDAVESGMSELKKTLTEAGASYRKNKTEKGGRLHAVEAEG